MPPTLYEDHVRPDVVENSGPSRTVGSVSAQVQRRATMTDAELEAEEGAQAAVEEQRTGATIEAMTQAGAHTPTLTPDAHKGLCYNVKKSLQGLLYTLLDTVAHFLVFIMLAHGSWLTAIVVSTAAGFTVFYTLFDGGSMAAKLDWQFVSFALVFPVTFFLAETWRRRERALSKMAGIKSLSLWLYLAHRDWLHQDKVPEGHLEKVKIVLVRMLCDLHGYITLRRLTTRDLYFAVGQNKHFMQFEAKRRAWRREMYVQMKLLSRLCENMKDYGLPTNEASRINQYHSLLMRDVEEVMNIKDYRTPQGIRSFTRVYVILIWVMFGSYYAWVAQQTGSLAFAVCLAITSSMALAGLIKVSMSMEDPFESIGVDDVRTSRDLAEVIMTIKDDELQDSLDMLQGGMIELESAETSMAHEPLDATASGLFPVLAVQKNERKAEGTFLATSMARVSSPKRPAEPSPSKGAPSSPKK
eukprot:CAMPEP_0117667504 /NCGR_PEP_ID=MMETSP0804-20121206/11010_1 /TAXON_ID=1074897 /ORGANISM="Tetraselmis astigmatica, Strain CCMP880" /LENGTH=469 /DNA_ID=CAMNT_0005475251 /DNA_START=193 /DNA_END=1602 /DNA_ORIENTATION=-